MQKEQQQYLNDRLSALEGNERRKLYKRASMLRKLSQKRGRPEEDGPVRRARSLDDIVLQLLRQEEVDEPAGEATGSGSVVWLGTKFCRVRGDTVEVECALPRAQPVAVGDRVSFGPHGDSHRIVAVLPRTTVLSRPDPFSRHIERVIAANIDTVVVVVSVIAPPLHSRIIDRYMIAIQRGGARMLLAVNKVNLLDDSNRDHELAQLQPYQELSAMLLCSTSDGTGIEQLKQMLAGQTCAFVGHSGVGKSSLLNAIEPGLAIAIGSVSQGYGRGTHTTTSSTLHELPCGTRLIDTPGIRTFGLWDITASELSWYFPEFEDYRAECKFGDCTHTHETACGVKKAVSSRRLSQARYDAYLRILTSL